jgi:hypothetical protein
MSTPSTTGWPRPGPHHPGARNRAVGLDRDVDPGPRWHPDRRGRGSRRSPSPPRPATGVTTKLTNSTRQMRMSSAEQLSRRQQPASSHRQQPGPKRVGSARFSFSALIARRIRSPQGPLGQPTPASPVQRRPCSPPRGESARLLPAGRGAGSPGEADSWMVWLLVPGRRSARATGPPTAGSRTPPVSRSR